jgi:regulator of RNase E activity RraA
MDRGILPLYQPIKALVGTALTIKAFPGDNWAIHGGLSQVQANDVLVIDWHGYHEGCGTGVLSLIAPIRRGLVGVVVDGAWRDIPEIQALDFPIFGRGSSPFSPAKHELGEINVPVCCGGVIVEPGDVIVAGSEGIVVVPRRHAEDVARALPPYETRSSIDDYPGDELAQSLDERGRRFRELFESKGGIST